MLTSVTAAYLPRNLRPEVMSITVHPPGAVFQRPFSTGDWSLPASRRTRRTVGSRRNRPPPSTAFRRAPRRSAAASIRRDCRRSSGRPTIENDDRLQYDVFYRREGETAWKPLKRGLWDPIVVWDTTSVPDGTYSSRSRRPTRRRTRPATALVGEFESVSFDIDNTPPRIEIQPAAHRPARDA